MPRMAKNNKSLNILAIRFSSIGDVATTVPVLDSFARQYPQHHITLISNPRFEAFFRGMPENFSFLGTDVKHKYNGFSGLKLLVSELASKKYDVVLDLHCVIRSIFISTGLFLRGSRVFSVCKDKMGRNADTRRLFKRHIRLNTVFERYSRVFEKAGMPVVVDFESIFKEAPASILEKTGSKHGRWVGIAPFAAHQTKVYPMNLLEKVVEGLEADESCSRIYVFAYGKELAPIIHWQNRFKKLTFVHGQITMNLELELMYWLDVMVSMDSSNMHMASLVGTRVVSIWGSTHPNIGFLGYGQKLEDCVQVDMDCRPCSVFGKKPCRYGNCPCMTGISPDTILNRLQVR